MSTNRFTEQELNNLPKSVLIKLILGLQENVIELKHILNVLMENDMGKELNISQMKNHKNI